MTKIHIPEPCHENWGNMTNTEKGRFCQSCEKEVVDFTRKSREEIIDHLRAASGNTCGRFLSEQIDKQLECTDTLEQSDPKTWKFWYRAKSVGLSVLAFFGFTLVGQTEAKAQKMGKVALPHPTNETAQTQTRIEVAVIEGKVQSEYARALKGANVSVESNGRIIGDAFTDEDGRYRITLRGGTIANGKITVAVYKDGFTTVEAKDIDVEKNKIVVDVVMESQYMLMGDVAYVEPQPPFEVTQGDTIIVDEVIEPETEIFEMGEPAMEIEEASPLDGHGIEPTKITCTMMLGQVAVIDEREEEPEQEPQAVELTIEAAVLETDTIMPDEEIYSIDGIEIDAIPEEELVEVVTGNAIVEEVVEVSLMGAVYYEEPLEEVVRESEATETTSPTVEEAPENRTEETPEEENTPVEPEDNAVEPRETPVVTPMVDHKPELFPNPSGTETTVRMQERDHYIINVYDANGKLAKTVAFKGRSQRIDVQDLRPGVYYVRINNREGSYQKTVELIVSR